jgi:RNA polymerase sigma factor (sigma-70 family)
MTPPPLPDPLHIFPSPEVVAIFCLIDPLGLRCSLTGPPTKRLGTVALALAIIRAWNKMLSAMAALPARRRSHGGGKAATLARSSCSQRLGASGTQPKPRRRRTSCREDQKKKIPKENSTGGMHAVHFQTGRIRPISDRYLHLLKMLTNLSKFENKSSFRTWLYRMAVNHFISATRKRSEIEVHSFGELGEFLDKVHVEEEMSPEEQSARRAQIRAIRDLCMTGTLLCLDRQQRIIFILGSIFNVSSTIAAEILDISPANFRKQLSRAKADLFQFMEDKCGLINPNNPCRCYKKTKGFIREGKVDALTQQFFPKVAETIDSIVGRKNEELDVLMEGKYLSLFRSQPYHEEDIAEHLVEKVLEDEDVRKLFQLD